MNHEKDQETGPQLTETKSTLITISVEDFKSQTIQNPQQYKEGDIISRDNFTSWLIRGYAISRSDVTVQYGYIRWSAAQTGLDSDTTINNFDAAGQDECLSDAEKEMLVNAYNRIKIHKENDQREGLHQNVQDVIKDICQTPTMFTLYKKPTPWDKSILKDFPNLDVFFDNLSKDEFMKWTNKRYEVTLARRNFPL